MKKNSFSEQCYEILRTIPKGKVTTYGAIAKALGTKAYRAVGHAMNRNPHAPIVPCHRVVGSKGELTGYAFGIKKKIELLTKEGISIENERVANLDAFFYEPPQKAARR